MATHEFLAKNVEPQKNAVHVDVWPDGRQVVWIECKDMSERPRLEREARRILKMVQPTSGTV